MGGVVIHLGLLAIGQTKTLGSWRWRSQVVSLRWCDGGVGGSSCCTARRHASVSIAETVGVLKGNGGVGLCRLDAEHSRSTLRLLRITVGQIDTATSSRLSTLSTASRSRSRSKRSISASVS